MKYNNKLIRMIVFMLVLLPDVPAQSLEDLLITAADNNLELKALHNDYLAANERAPQVSELPDPVVGVGIFGPETRVGPQAVRVGASQMFPWKGTLHAREEVALTMAQATYERIEVAKLNLFFQVKQAYFQLYELLQSREIVTRNLRIFEALERFTLAKVANGKGSTADVLRVQLKIKELQKELDLLQNLSKKPIASLNQVLNRPLNTPVSLTDSLELSTIPYNKDTLAAHLQNFHPLIRMFSTQQLASEKAIELNHLEGKPSFGVGVDYIFVSKRHGLEIDDNGKDMLMPMASVKVPLFRNKYSAKRKEEELKIISLDHQIRDTQLKFLSIIEQAYADWEDAAIRIQLYQDLIQTTQRTIDILETEYSTAGRNFDEWLRLQSELVNYDLKMLQAVVKSHLAKAMIERFVIL